MSADLTPGEWEWLLAEQTWKLHKLASERADELVSIAGWQRTTQQSIDKVLNLHREPMVQKWDEPVLCIECGRPYPCGTVEALR